MHFTVDKIVSKNWGIIKFHLIFWLAFIFYEISLLIFISHQWGNIWDYILHYVLDIGIFYFHCFFTLKKEHKKFWVILFWIVLEFGVFILLNFTIFYILKYFEISLTFNRLNSVFFLASAYRFIFILLISTAYWYMLQRIRSLKMIQQQQSRIFKEKLKNKQLKTSMLEEQLSKQKASIVPHFLFNTLHVLYHQIRKDKPQEAQHLLSLSEIMQYNLSPLDQQYKIPLSHELTYLRNYVALRQLERNYYLDLKIQIMEEVADELMIIPLVMATLIENVFHHGNLYQSECPASFSTETQQNTLIISIKNRVKDKVSSKNGIGIANMLARLGHFYPGQYQYNCYVENKNYIQKLTINL